MSEFIAIFYFEQFFFTVRCAGYPHIRVYSGGHVSERDIHRKRHSTVAFKAMRQQGDMVHQWLDDHLFIHILKYVGCWNPVPLLSIFLMLW